MIDSPFKITEGLLLFPVSLSFCILDMTKPLSFSIGLVWEYRGTMALMISDSVFPVLQKPAWIQHWTDRATINHFAFQWNADLKISYGQRVEIYRSIFISSSLKKHSWIRVLISESSLGYSRPANPNKCIYSFEWTENSWCKPLITHCLFSTLSAYSCAIFLRAEQSQMRSL